MKGVAHLDTFGWDGGWHFRESDGQGRGDIVYGDISLGGPPAVLRGATGHSPRAEGVKRETRGVYQDGRYSSKIICEKSEFLQTKMVQERKGRCPGGRGDGRGA